MGSPESPDSQEFPDSLETSYSPDVRISKYWQNWNKMSKFQNILDMDCGTSSVCVWPCENYIEKISKKTRTLTMPLWPMRMVHR